MPHFRHNGTTFKEVVSAFLHDGTVFKEVLAKWRHNGTDWKQYFDVTGAGFVVQITPPVAGGSCSPIIDPEDEYRIYPCRPEATVETVVTGGVGPFTYFWDRVPDGYGGGANFTAPDYTLPDITLSGTNGTSASERKQTWRVTVVDTDNMMEATDNVEVTLTREEPS